jgi:hypothetical protein
VKGEDMETVYLRTYLFLEAIYIAAADESLEETQALDLMDIVWNLLTKEETAFLDSRKVSST